MLPFPAVTLTSSLPQVAVPLLQPIGNAPGRLCERGTGRRGRGIAMWARDERDAWNRLTIYSLEESLPLVGPAWLVGEPRTLCRICFFCERKFCNCE
jgi:hypothetical protein